MQGQCLPKHLFGVGLNAVIEGEEEIASGSLRALLLDVDHAAARVLDDRLPTRAARELAIELELEGEHVRLLRTVEQVLDKQSSHFGRPLPVNVDGAIAAVTADLGFAYDLGNAVFLISRLPGLIAHAHEERTRQNPMRQIDPKDHAYDGARERRLPERRK